MDAAAEDGAAGDDNMEEEDAEGPATLQ